MLRRLKKKGVKDETAPNLARAETITSDPEGCDEEIFEGIHGRVLYDYNPEQEDEIALKEGETIVIYERDTSGWWTGEASGKYGLFPGAFVEVIESEVVVAKAAEPVEKSLPTVSEPILSPKLPQQEPAITVKKSPSSQPKAKTKSKPINEIANSSESNADLSIEELREELRKQRESLGSLHKKYRKLKRTKKKSDEELAKAVKKSGEAETRLREEIQRRSKAERVKEELERMVKTSSNKIQLIERENTQLKDRIKILQQNGGESTLNSLRSENASLKAQLLQKERELSGESEQPEGAEDFVMFKMDGRGRFKSKEMTLEVEGLRRELQQKEEEIAKRGEELAKYRNTTSRIDDIEQTMKAQLAQTQSALQNDIDNVKKQVHNRSSVPSSTRSNC